MTSEAQRFGAWSFPTPQIEERSQVRFGRTKKRRCLCRRKRGEAARQNVNANDPVRANGAGLINWIFAAKNSGGEHAKKAKF